MNNPPNLEVYDKNILIGSCHRRILLTCKCRQLYRLRRHRLFYRTKSYSHSSSAPSKYLAALLPTGEGVRVGTWPTLSSARRVAAEQKQWSPLWQPRTYCHGSPLCCTQCQQKSVFRRGQSPRPPACPSPVSLWKCTRK